MEKIKKENVLMLGYDFKREPLFITESDYDWKNKFIDVIKNMAEACERPAIALSGGIDSSVIAYYLKQYNPKATAFTMCLDDQIPVDESKEITKHINMKHIIKKVEINKQKIDDILDDIFTFYYPFDKGSLVPNYILFNLLKKENYDGVFFGDGADELFGGYDRHLRGNPSFERDLMIFSPEELMMFKLKPSIEVMDMQDDYDMLTNITDMLKFEWSHEFPNAHLLKMECMSKYFNINSLFPYLDMDVMCSALSSKPKFSFDSKIKKLPLYILYYRLYKKERRKIPLKFDYLKYISPCDIQDKFIKEYLMKLNGSNKTRNFNRKLWLTYMLERYERAKN